MPKDIYRSCASVAVFRPTHDGYEMLLVHKPRKNDAWQLPQGGVEQGECTEEAAIREVQEEAGITPTILGVSDHVYQYDFPKSYRRFRPDNVCGQRVAYVFAIVAADTLVQVDEQEIDKYAWVVPNDLSRYIKRKEYRGLVAKLYEDGMEQIRKIENSKT